MKRFCLFFSVICALLFSFVGCSFGLSDGVHSEYGQNGYTKEELIALFHEHKEDFLKVANIVLGSESFQEKLKNSKEGQASIWTYSSNHSFSDEEWHDITNLFLETGVQCINKNRKGGKDTIRYFFYQDKNHESFELDYCESDDASNLHYQRQYCFLFEKLEEHWWIGCRDESIYSGRPFGSDLTNMHGYNIVVFDVIVDRNQFIQELCNEILRQKTNDISSIEIHASSMTLTYVDGSIVTEQTPDAITQAFNEINNLDAIYVNERYILFSGWKYDNSDIGFCYNVSDDLRINDLYESCCENEAIQTRRGALYWENENGNESIYFIKVLPGYYYFKIHR